MTQDEILAMAREAGWDEHNATYDTRIERFAALVAAHEREWVEPSDEQIAKIKNFYEQASFETIARAVLKLAKELNS